MRSTLVSRRSHHKYNSILNGKIKHPMNRMGTAFVFVLIFILFAPSMLFAFEIVCDKQINTEINTNT